MVFSQLAPMCLYVLLLDGWDVSLLFFRDIAIVNVAFPLVSDGAHIVNSSSYHMVGVSCGVVWVVFSFFV